MKYSSYRMDDIWWWMPEKHSERRMSIPLLQVRRVLNGGEVACYGYSGTGYQKQGE